MNAIITRNLAEDVDKSLVSGTWIRYVYLALQQAESGNQAVLSEWLALFNQSLHSTKNLTIDEIVQQSYSHETFWLAHHYAYQLSSDISRLNTALADVIMTDHPIAGWRTLFSRPSVYRWLMPQLKPMTYQPLQVTTPNVHTIALKWDITPAFMQVHPENQGFYMQDMRLLINSLVHRIDQSFASTECLVIEREVVDEEAYFEWQVLWRHSTQRSRRIGLGIGIAASMLFTTLIVAGLLPTIFGFIALLPVGIGLGWWYFLQQQEIVGDHIYEQRDTIQRTESQLETLRYVYQIDRELNNVISTKRVSSLWLDWGIRLSLADSGRVMLIDELEENLELISSYGYNPDDLDRVLEEGRRHSWDKGITGRAVRTGKTIYVPNTTEDEDFFAFSERIRSQYTVPIKRGNKVIALLSLEKHILDGFSVVERARVAQVCERASVAMFNAILLREAEQERQKLNAILGATADSVIVTDAEHRLVLVNASAREVFGFDAEIDLMYKSLAAIFAETPIPELYQAGVEEEGMYTQEFDVGQRTFQAFMLPVEDVGYSLVLHDVTLFKEIDKLKNDLVATVSHDLKTPLSAIKGYIGLVEMSETITERGASYIDRAKKAVEDMVNLIDDLLNVARIDAGIKLDREMRSIYDLVNDVAEKYRVLSEKKNIAVTLDVPDTIPAVYVDPQRITQVIGNLLSNAIKYTPDDGRAWVRARQDATFIYVDVQDTGIGIPEDAIETLFDKFTRVPGEGEKQEGTGLGLYIVRKLVEAHGGNISVASVIGEGSTFTFSVPLEVSENGNHVAIT